MIRFVQYFNYSKGVLVDDGEAWYLGKHVPQAKKLPGLKHYYSWRALESPGYMSTIGRTNPLTSLDPFVRRSEMWFEDSKAGQQIVMANSLLWTTSREGIPGFKDFECMFLDEEPQYDLLRDAPPEQYQYITLPIMWSKGRPEVDDTEDFVVYSYFFNYRQDISIADGEDWYLGHHAREGKQLPGMKYYRTWKAIKVPEERNSPLRPNKWVRLTDLGMSFKAFYTTMVNGETRITFTPSPLGRVFGERPAMFHNKPELAEDFLR
jgi:hypothetical protein